VNGTALRAGAGAVLFFFRLVFINSVDDFFFARLDWLLFLPTCLHLARKIRSCGIVSFRNLPSAAHCES
jgi:hypothetical protein